MHRRHLVETLIIPRLRKSLITTLQSSKRRSPIFGKLLLANDIPPLHRREGIVLLVNFGLNRNGNMRIRSAVHNYFSLEAISKIVSVSLSFSLLRALIFFFSLFFFFFSPLRMPIAETVIKPPKRKDSIISFSL